MRPRFPVAFGAIALIVSAVTAADHQPLFPQPLHFTRSIEDGVGGHHVVVEEYCYGDRIVSVNGSRTIITDYVKQEMTEIDHTGGTWSVARFDELAKLQAPATPAARVAGDSASGPVEQWRSVAPQSLPRGARSSESFAYEKTMNDGTLRMEVSVDRSVPLSQAATEAVIGSSYPNTPRDEHEPLLRAASGVHSAIASNSTSADASYALPTDQILSYDMNGTKVTFRSTITRVGSEMPPADAMLIPPGARRVESRAAETARQLRELDQINPSRPQ